MISNESMYSVSRWVGAAFGAIFAEFIEPSLPYMLICTVAIFFDVITAWQLGRRVAARYPEEAENQAKFFSSKKCGKIITTLIKVYVAVIFAHFINIYITADLGFLDVEKLVAGGVTFWQIISVLENESSCNDAKWARLVQRILIDKTSRHLDIDPHILNKAVVDMRKDKRKEHHKQDNPGEGGRPRRQNKKES